MIKQKICIVGNGLTGLATAFVLKNLNLEIHLIGKFKKKKDTHDNRTTAISHNNYKFLINFIKDKKELTSFWPIKKINLFHEEISGYKNFLNFENNGQDLMHIIQNNKLKQILLEKIKKNKNVKIINTEITKIDEKNSSVFYRNKKVFYDLILLCAGSKSALVRKLLGKRTVINDTNEIAFITIVKHKLGIVQAKQFFLNEGPLAILPFQKNKFSIVWSINKEHSLDKVKFLLKEKLNKILKIKNGLIFSKVDFFPVSFKLNVNFINRNILVLGEGSYNIHPFAGQGFNLILRDIRELYNNLDQYLSIGIQIKDSLLLKHFSSSRKPENLLFGLGLSFIHKFFKNNKISNPIRRVILKDINKFKTLKDISLSFADKGIF